MTFFVVLIGSEFAPVVAEAQSQPSWFQVVPNIEKPSPPTSTSPVRPPLAQPSLAPVPSSTTNNPPKVTSPYRPKPPPWAELRLFVGLQMWQAQGASVQGTTAKLDFYTGEAALALYPALLFWNSAIAEGIGFVVRGRSGINQGTTLIVAGVNAGTQKSTLIDVEVGLVLRARYANNSAATELHILPAIAHYSTHGLTAVNPDLSLSGAPVFRSLSYVGRALGVVQHIQLLPTAKFSLGATIALGLVGNNRPAGTPNFLTEDSVLKNPTGAVFTTNIEQIFFKFLPVNLGISTIRYSGTVQDAERPDVRIRERSTFITLGTGIVL